MREEKMKETSERADFFIEISATSDVQKPTVTIRLYADTSTQTEVTKYQNLQQLTEALVKLGEDRKKVEIDLKRIHTAYAPVENVAMTGEPAHYKPNITIAQARDFGWED